MTYEGAHSIIGPFLKDLGATATEVGVIAGFGEMVAASLRYFSGRLADRTHAYWTLAISGYALNVLVVPALAFAGDWKIAALLVVAERTGKALRGPARDVLLSEATSTTGHGWGYGLHAAMDQTGAVVGPLLMFLAVARHNGHFGPAFLWLGVPAVLAVSCLVTARALNPLRGQPPAVKKPKALPSVFWPYITAAGLLACGFVDFPLLGYHIENARLMSPSIIPLLFAGVMAVEGFTAMIFGRLFDRFGIVVLAAGTVISVVALPLGFLGGQAAVLGAVVLLGLGLGAQDATLRGGIAQVVSMNKRGSAFGIFNAVFGVMWFVGSTVMGVLYDRSVAGLVVFGVVAQLLSAVMFVWLRKPLADAVAAAAT